jgi:hypothetical protein
MWGTRISRLWGMCLMAFAAAAAAQAQPVVTPGARIRLVQVDSKKVDYVGSFMQLSGDTLTLRDEFAVVRTIPLAGYRVETGGGRHRHILPGAALGAGAGLLVGLVAQGIRDGSRDCAFRSIDGSCARQDVEEAVDMATVVYGVVVGGVIGGTLGVIPHERWTAAVLQPQVSMAPTGGVWSVGFTVKF